MARFEPIRRPSNCQRPLAVADRLLPNGIRQTARGGGGAPPCGSDRLSTSAAFRGFREAERPGHPAVVASAPRIRYVASLLLAFVAALAAQPAIAEDGPGWVTIDGASATREAPPAYFSSPPPVSFWTALGRWESRLWRAERPTIVLTADETPLTGADDAAPGMPGEQPQPIAPADGLMPSLAPASATATDWQPVDVCPCPQPISFADDAWAFLPRVAHDAWGVVNWDNAIVLGTALGGSLALRGDVDQDVRNWTAEHPDRWGHATNFLGDIGTVQYQIPVLLGAYAFTVWTQDEWHHDMMTSMISAYTIFGLSTLTIKGIADTHRPSDGWNGGSYGFPSWHDGSLFCISAVIDDYEGHWIGVPLYILSGLVGWSRIDARDHDLSDVIFGGVLGYVIGKSVAGRALYGDGRAVHILPYIHPGDGSAGVMFDARF